MSSLVVVGTQWGDEGKGKIVDYLAQKADVVIRYQGGPNAGHSVKYGKTSFVFHQLPSGLTNPRARCLVGAGCVIDLGALRDELVPVRQAGISYEGRLFIDRKVHLILPYHKTLDRLREESRGQRRIGTTIRGIGPAYEDKYARIGIRFADLLQEDAFADRLRRNLAFKNFLLMELYKADPLSARQIKREFAAHAVQFSSMAADGSKLVAEALKQGDKVLFEGAQGALLDIDHGTYPFVTSSSPIPGGACTGVGVGPAVAGNVLGVSKAYTTRVGKGPFPTEASGKLARYLRERGSEYGATTGRPRRCGWFDAALVRYSIRLGGIRRIALTKFDILDEMPVIPMCVGYETPQGFLADFDPTAPNLKPRYIELPGWKRTTAGARRLEDMPKEARSYVARIEKELDVEVAIVSVGPDRTDTIIRSRSKWFI
jgi:adenylosuccinate synthase